MSEIKRMSVDPWASSPPLVNDEAGELMYYEDHLSALAQARAEMKERCALRVDSAGYPGLAQNIRSIDEGE